MEKETKMPWYMSALTFVLFQLTELFSILMGFAGEAVGSAIAALLLWPFIALVQHVHGWAFVTYWDIWVAVLLLGYLSRVFNHTKE